MFGRVNGNHRPELNLALEQSREKELNQKREQNQRQGQNQQKEPNRQATKDRLSSAQPAATFSSMKKEPKTVASNAQNAETSSKQSNIH
jgi:hypothetical protein